jgi:hypothetical protein
VGHAAVVHMEQDAQAAALSRRLPDVISPTLPAPASLPRKCINAFRPAHVFAATRRTWGLGPGFLNASQLQGAGRSGQEAARWCTLIGGFVPHPTTKLLPALPSA